MSAPYLTTQAVLHLRGTAAPAVEATWSDEHRLGVTFQGGPGQGIGLVGTPQEVRLALARGLVAVDRAVAERGGGPDWRTVEAERAEQHESFACAVFHGPLGEPLGKEATTDA